MAAPGEPVTVDKAYFDALLRRADFHTRSLGVGHEDPSNITISRGEYDNLHRQSREYELLKNSLFSGGITAETLSLLISGGGDAAAPEKRPKSYAWTDDFDDNGYGTQYCQAKEQSWKYGGDSTGAQQIHPGNGAYLTGQVNLRAPSNQPAPRYASYGTGPSSTPEDTAFDEADSYDGSSMHPTNSNNKNGGNTQRTLYFAGLPARTTYRDILSVIKGGKILSINLRSEKSSATVTFFDAAADYLTWTKRNDIYLHCKRIDVRWADRQFRLNQHIANKVNKGATRNLCIRGAASHGLDEQRIREDMEHIHNLIIVNITFRNGAGDAYASTNSVHNALFARTCMMSRSTYKGCKIEFYPDECDVPLPLPVPRSLAPTQRSSVKVKGFETGNRFGMLEVEVESEGNDAGGGGSSDEENREPIVKRVDDDEGDELEDEDEGCWSRSGVSLG